MAKLNRTILLTTDPPPPPPASDAVSARLAFTSDFGGNGNGGDDGDADADYHAGDGDVGSIQVPAPEQMLESLWDTENDDVFDEVRKAFCSRGGGETIFCGRGGVVCCATLRYAFVLVFFSVLFCSIWMVLWSSPVILG